MRSFKLHSFSGFYSWKITEGFVNGNSFSVYYSIDTVNVSVSGPMQLPGIVICLETPWDVKKSNKIMSIDLLSYMANLIFPFGGFADSLYNKKREQSPLKKELDKEYNKILHKTGWNVVDLLNNITLTCGQIVTSCNFGYRLSGNLTGIDCCKYMFSDPVYGVYGKCFRTSTRFYKIFLKEAGHQSSFLLNLVVPSDILDDLNKSILNQKASISDGLSIAVSNKNSHLSTIEKNFRGLVPNSMNSVIVRKMTINKSQRNSPFGRYQCISEDDIQAYMSLTPGYFAYTRDNCIVAQKQNIIAEKYNCSLIYYKPVPGTAYCSPNLTTFIYNDRYI